MDLEEKRIIDLPKRLKGPRSNGFKPITFQSNYFFVNKAVTIKEIYIFKVVYSPSIPFDNSKLRMSLLEKIRGQLRDFIQSPVFSGNNIYSLQPPKCPQKSFQADNYTISIKQVKCIKDDEKSLLHFLNVGLRNLLRRLDFTQIGKSGKFFNCKGAQKIDSQLKMFYGVKANFLKLEKGIFLRVDTARKIVRNQTVLDFINSIYQTHRDKDRDIKRSILKEELVGKTVMTNYGKTRYLRIMDIMFQTVDETKLENSDITLRQFYDSRYKIQINHAKQPLLVVESRDKNQSQKTIMIPQLCLMTGIPDSFDEFKRKKVSEATIKSASEKKSEIQKFMKKIMDAKDLATLKDIGINLNHNMEKIQGKLIPSPNLALGNNRSVERGRQSNFQLFRDPIYSGSHSIKCGIIATQNIDLRSCIDTFRSTSDKLRVKFEFVTLTVKENDRRRIIEAFLNSIDSAVKKQRINICLVVIPNFLKHNYQQIKKQCLQKSNVVSQCAVQSTLKKKNLQSIATKILLQMIAKRGNTLWVPELSSRLQNTMIMAFDKAKSSKNTILSCCATMNETFSSIYSKTASFNADEEKFQQMKKLAIGIISEYTRKNNNAPKEIIIFHNSSSGDQVKIYKEFFIDILSEELEKSNTNAAITFIMVNTKTNERFFSQDHSGVKNVQAGTLVSDDIVSQNYDFYLVSQFSTRGSIVPNHYKVIYSNSKLEEGVLHELAYSQCFNYVNWTGSIKVPGILQYAKKCAKFATEALSGQKVHGDLEGKLYFV